MLFEFVLATFTLLLILLYGFYKYNYKYWKQRNVHQIEPVFPFGSTRVINSGFNLGSVSEDFYKHFKALGLQYGGVFIGPTPKLVLVDLEIIKRIFTKDFAYFTGRGNYVNERDESIFAGLFNLSGGKWLEMRRKLTPSFTTGKMRVMFETMVECARNMEQALLEEEEGLEVKVLCSRFTTDAAVRCFFGVECDCFKNPDGEFRIVGRKAFSLDLAMRIKRFLTVATPELAEFLGLKTINEEATDMFHQIVNQILTAKKTKSEKHQDVVQHLIDLQVDTNQIIAELFFFYLAGFESAAIPLQFCLYELAKNEEFQKRARMEVEEVFERYQGELSYEAVKELEFLGQVIDETQRLYPVVPTLTRKCDLDYHLPNGNLTINRGIHVIIPLYAIHRDEAYHPNPNLFNPDRFNAENKKKIPQFAYMPFGEGRKLCIGNRFSLLLLKVGLCVLLKNFEFRVNPKTTPQLVVDKSAFLLAVKSPVFLDYKRLC